MKNLKSIALAVVAFVTLTATAQTKQIDASKSTINWVGKKVTGSHEGTINLKDGALVFKENKLSGGIFNVDMTSINTTDLEGKSKANLETHLKSEDFFGTENFPTANLSFKKIVDKGNGVYGITADLTIKGITNSINFDMTVTDSTAIADLKVDRTKYKITYKSGNFFTDLGDKAIYDDFLLKVKLVF
ncbi:YceI family protein [Flavobacterium ardleyense]|uniref:YceI family protein n=1 Tax=Flavobacterium ardleyense TaxID=2038737 RepID=A0ABW5Z4F0_9FLAO